MERNNIRKPDFFIVGAPKSGTTAMQTYLQEHTNIFMPEMKEIHHFADDLLKPNDPFLDRDKYLSLFKNAKENQLIGETSVFYLLSENAARNIKSFCTDAKIIIMLRNPMDVMYSLHSQLVFNGEEDIENFEEALAAESLRKRGVKLPKRTRIYKKHLYTEVVKFSEQVKRYFDLFGRENVHVIIYDDFKKDTAKVYKDTLKFLGIDSNFQPEFKIINPNKKVRSKMLQKILIDPPSLALILIPKEYRETIVKTLMRLNTQYMPRPSMSPELRKQLQKKFESEIEQLSNLLGRDLTYWCND